MLMFSSIAKNLWTKLPGWWKPEVCPTRTRSEPPDIGTYTKPVIEHRDFEGCVGPLRGEMVNFARRLGASPERADDVVQDAMLRLYRAWERFTPSEEALSFDHAVRSYLYRIVHNEVLRYAKADSRRPDKLWRETDVNFGDNIATAAEDPRYIQEESTSDPIFEAVASLQPHQRVVVEMFYLQGIGVREIAAELQISRQTVKTRLHRAREVLTRSYALREHAMASGYVDRVTN